MVEVGILRHEIVEVVSGIGLGLRISIPRLSCWTGLCGFRCIHGIPLLDTQSLVARDMLIGTVTGVPFRCSAHFSC
eukprot:1255923-Amphidinium_carterae.1